MANDPQHVDRLTALLHPVPVPDFAGTVRRWLQDAHDAAASLQPGRSGPRGNWHNNTSFGTDRYQYLRATADSLTGELPGLEVDAAFQSVLLKLPRVGMYQLLMPAGPEGSLGDASDLRRELFGGGDGEGLISRRDAWLSGRELLFLPWTGTEATGLTGVWAGQGRLDDNHIDWDWLVRLRDVAADAELTPDIPAGRLAPDAFGLPQPMLPLRPRSEAPAATE